jgi:hypothetical protein
MTEHIQDTARYRKALAWARALRAPGRPLEFPELAEYVRLAAEAAPFDIPDEADSEAVFHGIPEEFELAYLQVKLERLKARIKTEKGLDVGAL